MADAGVGAPGGERAAGQGDGGWGQLTKAEGSTGAFQLPQMFGAESPKHGTQGLEPGSAAGDGLDRPSVPVKKLAPGEDGIDDPQQHFCVAVLNGQALLRCAVPRPSEGEGTVASTSTDLEGNVAIFGEPEGAFLQIMFYSPNFPAKPDYSVHGTLEFIGEDGKVNASVYLGVLDDSKQVEKKQRTVAQRPAAVRLEIHRISPLGPNPNEAQLIEEITAVLENPKLNPQRGSLPSVLVQHRAKESPLYDKVVGRRFGNSWHAFMKANQETFNLFHYSQKEIQDRKLAPYCKFNEARIVLRKHEQAHDWRSADEHAAQKHADAEEGLKQHLMALLEQRDYDQRELLETLNGNVHFNHFLSPTFSILMRTLNRHKGTFIASTDPDQPTRVGLARADRFQARSGPMIAPRATAPVPPPHLRHRPPVHEYAQMGGGDGGGGGGGGGERGGGGGGGGGGKAGRRGGDRDFGGGHMGMPGFHGKGGGKGKGYGGMGGGYRGSGKGRFDDRRFGNQSQFMMQDQFSSMGGGGGQIVLQGQNGQQQVVSSATLQMSDPQLYQALSQIPGLDQNTTVVVVQQQGQQVGGGRGGDVQYIVEHVSEDQVMSIDGMPPPGLTFAGGHQLHSGVY
eukprot:TRINITY_DN47040_c0_g1_i1.p1 TRINITY_DN47040_c0_g1~~TRINITY_DN47040_c0_g1_i1.p1  ORF type:complete len:622 (+),score=261.27 TRINITY_DN47040_c0_g1_i1:87-1952(+)